MELVGMIYKDRDGNTFFVQQETLPKNKGNYKFWTAEPAYVVHRRKEKCFRADKKHELLEKIEGGKK